MGKHNYTDDVLINRMWHSCMLHVQLSENLTWHWLQNSGTDDVNVNSIWLRSQDMFGTLHLCYYQLVNECLNNYELKQHKPYLIMTVHNYYVTGSTAKLSGNSLNICETSKYFRTKKGHVWNTINEPGIESNNKWSAGLQMGIWVANLKLTW